MKKFALAALLVFNVHNLRADVKLPAIFGDHMVLQQEATLPIWGLADPGEEVTVTIGGRSASASTGGDGKWNVQMPALPPGTPPVTFTVAGRNTLKFEDVLVGDVWVCAGQSNMAFHLPQPEARDANDPQIRFFVVPQKTAMQPQDGLGSSWVWERTSPHFLQLRPESEMRGKWVVCTPESAADFSAVGYYFARELRASLKRPIGLIGSYWVGSGANLWVSLSGLRKDPELKGYTDVYDKVLTVYATNEAALSSRREAFQTAMRQWEKDGKDAQQTWYAAVKKAEDAGLPAPPKPAILSAAPESPMTPDGGPRNSTTVFNAMISPLIPFAIKGVAWYQGESNHSRPLEYQTLLSRLIADWREKWGEGDFPFLIVQLPNLIAPNPDLPFVRESQLRVAQTVKNTGIAVTIDAGDPNNGHPHNKLFVGLRLAQAARHIAYGQDVVYSGPIYESMKIEGKNIRVRFTNTGGGLVIGSAPYLPPGVQPIPATSLAGFEIAGEDQHWMQADASIDGGSVIVSNPAVDKPIAVRYGWDNSPRCNLYNKESLPASPFRTDNWPPTFRHDDFNPPPFPRTLSAK